MATNVALSDFVNATMSEWYKNVQKLPNTKYWLNNNLTTKIVNHKGEDVLYIPMQIQLPESATPAAEGSANPTSRSPAFAKGTLYMKKIVAPMRFTEETVALNQGADVIVKNLENISNGTLESFNMAREFMMHQAADGILCTSAGAAAGQVITVDSCRWLRVGMVIDGYDASNNQDANSIVITDVDYDAKTFTCTGTVSSVDANTRFFYEDTYTASGGAIGTTKYCNGIETLVNDSDPAYGDILGIDRATYSYADAVVKYGGTPGTAEALTLGRMRSVMDSIDMNWGQDYPDLIYTDPGSFNSFQELLRNENQPTISMPTEGGFPDGLAFVWNGRRLRVVSSRLAKPNTMFFLNFKHLLKYKGGDTGWDTMAGSFQKVAGYQMFERVFRGWENYAVDVFKAHGRLNDITATT